MDGKCAVTFELSSGDDNVSMSWSVQACDNCAVNNGETTRKENARSYRFNKYNNTQSQTAWFMVGISGHPPRLCVLE